jgi:hypothetical protein
MDWRYNNGVRCSPDVRSLGFIRITDTATDSAGKVSRVDHLLASVPGDNHMDYWVRRAGGPLSGPYDLAGLADWTKNGRMLSSDETKNIALPEWSTVGAVLAASGISIGAYQYSANSYAHHAPAPFTGQAPVPAAPQIPQEQGFKVTGFILAAAAIAFFVQVFLGFMGAARWNALNPLHLVYSICVALWPLLSLAAVIALIWRFMKKIRPA